MTRYPARTTAIAVALCSLIFDTAITLQVLFASRSLQWEEVEFEWESADKGRLESIKLIWYLLLAYFGSAAIVCGYGLIGVLKSNSSMVRIYRDCSIADLAFRMAFTVFCAYYAFQSTTSLAVCEELSRHAQLIQDLADTGLSTDNCERWFERAAMASVGILALVNIVRLHFIMAISHYHQHLYRFAPTRTMSMGSHSRTHSRKLSQDQHLQRVYLLPRDNSLPPDGTVLVYAPVPLSELSPEVAQNLKKTATEAWFRQDSTASSSSPSTTRSRAHSNAYKNRFYETGRISLPIRQGEGLLEGDKDS